MFLYNKIQIREEKEKSVRIVQTRMSIVGKTNDAAHYMFGPDRNDEISDCIQSQFLNLILSSAVLKLA